VLHFASELRRGVNEGNEPRVSDFEGRMIDGLRKAGMPEE
jgi:hypothetical protein